MCLGNHLCDLSSQDIASSPWVSSRYDFSYFCCWTQLTGLSIQKGISAGSLLMMLESYFFKSTLEAVMICFPPFWDTVPVTVPYGPERWRVTYKSVISRILMNTSRAPDHLDRLEWSLKLHHLGELWLGCQRLMAEEPESARPRFAIHPVCPLPAQGKMFYM